MAERITLYKSENSIQSDIGLLKPDKLYRSSDKKFWLMVEMGEYDGVCPILSSLRILSIWIVCRMAPTIRSGQIVLHWVQFDTRLRFLILTWDRISF